MPLPSSVTLIGAQFQLAPSSGCLGVAFNNRLNWTADFASIRQKCFSNFALLSRLHTLGVPLSTLAFLCHSLFEPLFAFGIVVWAKTFASHSEQLGWFKKTPCYFRLCFSAILGLNRSSSVLRRTSELNVVTLNQLYAYRVGCVMFKLLNLDRPLSRFRSDLQPPLVRLTRNYHVTDDRIETKCYNYVINIPSYQHALLWNLLPSDVSCLKHFARFRTALLQYVRNFLI